MATIPEIRALAERCFAAADAISDAAAQDLVRSRGYRYLQEAASIEQREAEEVLGEGRWHPATPLQQAALVQLARVQQQIAAIEADQPRERSARANIVAALHRKRVQLEQILAVAAPEPPRRRPPRQRRPPADRA
jgi:hypothetical protein